MKKLILTLFLFFIASAEIHAATATFYANTDDGRIQTVNTVWDTVHDATTGDTVGTAETSGDSTHLSIGAMLYVGSYTVIRMYFNFDTSDLPDNAVISSVRLYLKHKSIAGQTAITICALKSTAGSPLTASDFDSFSGSSYGAATMPTDGTYFYINFNATGIGDISKTGNTPICVQDYTYDFLDSAPASLYFSGIFWADSTDTTSDPYLEIEYTIATTISGTILKESNNSGSGEPYGIAVIDTTNRSVYGFATANANGNWSLTVANGSNDYTPVAFDTVDDIYNPIVLGDLINGE